MTPNPSLSLADLTRPGEQAWRVSLVQTEIGGGKLERSALQELDAHPEASVLSVSGLDQTTFEELVSSYGSRYTGIHFWKCPKIADLSPLEDLPNLELAAFYWNQHATRLWDFSRTPRLRGLEIDDFTRLHDLSDLCSATSLEELGFGNKISIESVFDSLEPLSGLESLKRLRFEAKRIKDGRCQPLAKLQKLHVLDFPSNQFTTREVAWLRAHLPASVQGRSLRPLIPIEKAIDFGPKPLDVILVGKRQPLLNAQLDVRRIERHVNAFAAMVTEFTADPDLQPS